MNPLYYVVGYGCLAAINICTLRLSFLSRRRMLFWAAFVMTLFNVALFFLSLRLAIGV